MVLQFSGRPREFFKKGIIRLLGYERMYLPLTKWQMHFHIQGDDMLEGSLLLCVEMPTVLAGFKAVSKQIKCQ